MRSRCHRSARALGTWLACHWWRRDGNALAGRVRRCCREAAAPPGTPFLGNDPGGAWRLPLNPRSDDSSRLVDEVAHRCGRGVIALPAPLGPGWRVTGGGVMAIGRASGSEGAVATVPPVWLTRFSERSRGELRSLVSVRSVRDATNRDPAFEADARLAMALLLSEELRRSDSDTTHLDSSTRWLRGAVAVSSLRPRPWDLVGLSLVAA